MNTRTVAQDKNMLKTCLSHVPGFRSRIFLSLLWTAYVYSRLLCYQCWWI